MVGHARPGRAARHIGRTATQASQVNPIHREQRRQRREGHAPRLLHVRRDGAQQINVAHRRVQPLTPIIEVTGDQQQGLGGHVGGDEIGQALHLSHPAGVHQAQVRNHRVNLAPLPIHHNMQQAPLLETVIADIVMADVIDRPAREQGIAMLTLACHSVGSVGHLVAFGGEELGLALVRPAKGRSVKAALVAAVIQADLLQEDEIGVERLNGKSEVVDFQALAQADPAHALVDVVGRHAQDLVAGRKGRHQG